MPLSRNLLCVVGVMSLMSSCSSESDMTGFKKRAMECWDIKRAGSDEELKLKTSILYLKYDAPISGSTKCPGEDMTFDFGYGTLAEFIDKNTVKSAKNPQHEVFDIEVVGKINEARSNEMNIVFNVSKILSVVRNDKLTENDIMNRALGRDAELKPK